MVRSSAAEEEGIRGRREAPSSLEDVGLAPAADALEAPFGAPEYSVTSTTAPLTSGADTHRHRQIPWVSNGNGRIMAGDAGRHWLR